MFRFRRFRSAIVPVLGIGSLVAAATTALAVDYTFTVDDPVGITQVNWAIEVDAVLTNNAAVGDRYDILRTVIHRPPNWTTPMCVETCLPDFVDSTAVLVSAGQSDTIGIQFNTAVDEGGAIIRLTARSWTDPLDVKTVTMAMITDGTEVLIVDDDGGQAYQDYLSAALDGQFTWGVWPRDLEAPVSADLLEFDVAAWMTGESAPALSEEDTLAIGACLDGGGRLFLSGQNVGYDLCDPASPYFSAGMKAFYEDRLGAEYILDDTDLLTVEGVGGDPITDGLTLAISGGDGADNQTAPSEISPLGAGSAEIFHYLGTTRTAAVRVERGGSKCVYLAFGFEAIASASDRADLAAGIFDWLSPVGAVQEDAGPGFRSADLRCYPNPFNPSVNIAFSRSSPARVSVDIYDVRGKRVVSIPAGTEPLASVSVEWDGRDAHGQPVASGIYTCRVSTDHGETFTEKLILLK